MHNLIKRLEKIGWSKKEIVKAINIIKKAKQNKQKDIAFLDKRIYWIMLIAVIAANFAISVALLPLLISLKGMALYFIIIILGVVFGLLFELVIRSIEHLERKHHLFLAVLIPLIALANVFVISNVSNNLTGKLNLSNFQNPFIIGIIYATSFVLPYILYRFILKIEYYAKE